MTCSVCDRSSCSCRQTSPSGGRFAIGLLRATRPLDGDRDERADDQDPAARIIDGSAASCFEESSLRFKKREVGLGRRLGKPQMEIGRWRGLAASGRTHDEFSAQEVGLDFVFEGIDRHIHGGGQCTRRRWARPRRRGSGFRDSGGLAYRVPRNRSLACRGRRGRPRD